jgi:hypothetical protein
MSLTFTNIVNKIDRSCGTNSTSYTLANKAIDVNLALDDIYTIALKAIGWNLDDFNHTHDPFITINLEASQRDYHFTTDEDSARILEIHRVMVKSSSTGVYELLTPVDQQSDGDMASFYDGQNTTGSPTRYDKTGNGIYLDPIPATFVTSGLKVFISREASYFTSADTTKVAGIDGLCHDYLYLKPAYEWARDHGLQNREALWRDLQTATDKIIQRYGTRQKDVKKRLSFKVEDNK